MIVSALGPEDLKLLPFFHPPLLQSSRCPPTSRSSSQPCRFYFSLVYPSSHVALIPRQQQGSNELRQDSRLSGAGHSSSSSIPLEPPRSNASLQHVYRHFDSTSTPHVSRFPCCWFFAPRSRRSRAEPPAAGSRQSSQHSAISVVLFILECETHLKRTDTCAYVHHVHLPSPPLLPAKMATSHVFVELILIKPNWKAFTPLCMVRSCFFQLIAAVENVDTCHTATCIPRVDG